MDGPRPVTKLCRQDAGECVHCRRLIVCGSIVCGSTAAPVETSIHPVQKLACTRILWTPSLALQRLNEAGGCRARGPHQRTIRAGHPVQSVNELLSRRRLRTAAKVGLPAVLKTDVDAAHAVGVGAQIAGLLPARSAHAIRRAVVDGAVAILIVSPASR